MMTFKGTVARQLELIESGKSKIRFAKIKDIMNPFEGMHCHPFPEIGIMVGGLSKHCFPNENINLYKDDMIIIPRGVPHIEYVYNHNGEFAILILRHSPGKIIMHFSTASKENRPLFYKVMHLECDDSHSLFEYLETASHLHFDKKRDGTRSAINGLLCAFLGRILTLISSSKSAAPAKESTKVLITYEYIERNISSPDLNVKKIATDISCSADYLSHTFAKETGKKITEFINQKRIELAMEFLSKTNLSIGQISKSCGYADTPYFNRQFKKIAKCMPKEFRKQTSPHTMS